MTRIPTPAEVPGVGQFCGQPCHGVAYQESTSIRCAHTGHWLYSTTEPGVDMSAAWEAVRAAGWIQLGEVSYA